MKPKGVWCQLAVFVMPLLFLPACSANKDQVQVVEVSTAAMSRLAKFDTAVVFFTSRANPIKRLDDLTGTTKEVGMWGFELYGNMKELLAGTAAKDKYGIIGDAHFPELFTKNPQLRIFATWSTNPDHTTIAATGGGIRIKFVENASLK